MEFDPVRLHAAIGAAVGGVIYGTWHLLALLASGKTPQVADFMRAGLNLAAAAVCGGLAAFFLATVAIAILPWAAVRDPYAVGFVIGFFGWEIIPLLEKIVRLRIGEKQ